MNPLNFQTGDVVILKANYDDHYDKMHIPKGAIGKITDFHLLISAYDVEFDMFGVVCVPEEMLFCA